jgi:hypothetical protein
MMWYECFNTYLIINTKFYREMIDSSIYVKNELHKKITILTLYVETSIIIGNGCSHTNTSHNKCNQCLVFQI